MFTNKAPNGKNNFCGEKISIERRSLGISQRELAERLQLSGLDVDKNAIQRIEAGLRFITDIELWHFSKVLGLSLDELFAEAFKGI